MMPDYKENGSKTVLVTGGSGYLAEWAIVELLRQGYHVRTTLRDLKRESQVRQTIAKEVEPGNRLSFVEADLLQDAGWDAAMAGVDYALHIASPLSAKGDIITAAREGTLRVLRAAQKAGVKRAVVTSSGVAALPTTGYESAAPTDETTWTDPTAKNIDEYSRSKTLAERAAWDFMAGQTGSMTLATVLPGFVIGPVLDKTSVSESVGLVGRLLTGKLAALPRLGFGVVDTRDVVDLHLRAMTMPEAAGQRFLAVGDFLWLEDMAKILRKHFGSRAPKIPTRRMPDLLLKTAALFSEQARFMAPRIGKKRLLSSAKAEKLLGWRPRPVQNTFIDAAESLIKEGVVQV